MRRMGRIVQTPVTVSVAALFLMVLLILGLPTVQAKACLNNADCWTGSYCQVSGFCSNRFESGCFHAAVPGWSQLRVCNSEDPPDAEGTTCRPNEFDYQELRIYADNWDSAIYAAWLMQVVLSELLGVPCTVETGTDTAQVSFYNPESRFEYGPGNQHVSLQVGNAVGDCRLANQKSTSSDETSEEGDETATTYEPCAHAALESWTSETFWASIENLGLVEQPQQTNGLLGQEAWFVTRFTAVEDPSIVSDLGLTAQREKLARMFLRPTTWKDYCTQESSNGCATPDGTAQRAPLRSDEEGRYFVDGLYTGYFRATEENDCEQWPDNCTGHIADYPCGWTSSVEAQAYHLDIALRSSGPAHPHSRGYSYGQMQELWHAANATKSNLMMYYWYPEPLYHKFEGTDAAFTRINLPPPTQECYDNKVDSIQRCQPSKSDRVGSPLGVCDDLPDLLDKIIVASLYDLTHDPAISEAARNPGYDAIRAYHLDNLQLGQLFRKNFQHDNNNINPRAAVCEWMVENMDYMQSMVPPTYPRTLEHPAEFSHPGVLASLALASLAVLLVAATAMAVHVQSQRGRVPAAQVEFLRMVLVGAFLLSVGALLEGAPPSPARCVSSIWLVTVGYTLQLVPLIVKMMAIHHMIAAARRMRRVNLRRRKLYSAVAIVIVLVAIYLMVWSVYDTPRVAQEFVLTDEQRESDGATMVRMSDYCASERQSFWEYGVVGWDTILLLCSSVIAYQTRNLDPAFNESRTLAFMIYSHFVFVLLRLLVLGLKGTLQESTLSQIESMVLSVDTIAGIFIYFFPLLAMDQATGREAPPRSTVVVTTENPMVMKASSIGGEESSAATPRLSVDRQNTGGTSRSLTVASSDPYNSKKATPSFVPLAGSANREPATVESLRKKVLENRQTYYSSKDECSGSSGSEEIEDDDYGGAVPPTTEPLPETAPIHRQFKSSSPGLMDDIANSDVESSDEDGQR